MLGGKKEIKKKTKRKKKKKKRKTLQISHVYGGSPPQTGLYTAENVTLYKKFA
jgi:hypothetical protein